MAAVSSNAKKSRACGRTVLKLYSGNETQVKIILKIIKIYYENSTEKKYKAF